MFCNQEIEGDVLIRVLHQTLGPGSPTSLLFRIQLHVSFLNTPQHIFRYSELDNTTAGPLNDSRFSPKFTVTLFFDKENDPFDAIPIESLPNLPTVIPLITTPNAKQKRFSAPPVQFLELDDPNSNSNSPAINRNSKPQLPVHQTNSNPSSPLSSIRDLKISTDSSSVPTTNLRTSSSRVASMYIPSSSYSPTSTYSSMSNFPEVRKDDFTFPTVPTVATNSQNASPSKQSRTTHSIHTMPLKTPSPKWRVPKTGASIGSYRRERKLSFPERMQTIFVPL